MPVFDWRTSVQNARKLLGQWHFKLQISKRITISKTENGVTVRGESVYHCTAQSLKKGKRFNLQSKLIETGIQIKNDKEISITKLIERHFGKDWKNNKVLEHFKPILNESQIVQGGFSFVNTEGSLAALTKEEEKVLVEDSVSSERFCSEETLDFDL
nr:unnamed protein product [Callosobruchus analis]